MKGLLYTEVHGGRSIPEIHNVAHMPPTAISNIAHTCTTRNIVHTEVESTSLEIDIDVVLENQYPNDLNPNNIVLENASITEDILSVNDSISTIRDDNEEDDNVIDREFDMENTYATLNEISNKVISFPQLKKEVENGLLCKQCILEHGLSGYCASTLSVRQETYGIATVFKFSCGNSHTIEIIPERLDNERPKHHASNFMINYKLLLLMQFLGKGIKSITVITGLLGIRVSLGFYPIWKKMLNRLGIAQEELAQQCCDENLSKEIEETEKQGNVDVREGRVGIVASGDTGWQGGGSRITYNSISGHTLLCGGYTKLVIAFKFFSKMCDTCHNFYKKHGPNADVNLIPEHRCAKNWNLSSKAMEPNGIVSCALSIWNTGRAWLRTFVSDDDSSSRAALKYSVEARKELDNTNDWPRDEKGHKVKDTGKLPAWIIEPLLFLVDPSHRRRVYGSHLFKLHNRMSAFKKTDCECLIRNFGYAMKQNHCTPKDHFARAMDAAFHHHFNSHENCGNWCPFVKYPKEEWDQVNREKYHNKLRNKDIDKTIYDEAKAIHDIFTSDINLDMMNHEFDSQENEALNKANTKLAPKNMVFSRSRSLSDRLCLVIAYASIGYFDTVTRILQLLVKNNDYKLEPVATAWTKQQDAQRAKKKERERIPKSKGMRAAKRKANLKENHSNNKTAKKSGDIYEHGHAVPIPAGKEPTQVNPTQKPTAISRKRFIGFEFDKSTGYPIDPTTQRLIDGSEPYCIACKNFGHSRISFGGCGKNKFVLERLAKEEALRLQQSVVQTTEVITTIATENE